VFVRAYPRETQEMVFDAHARAFDFFGGVPTRGIYDNMKTAVTTVFTGKERVFNRRFLIMADHYMIEPTACSPAAGWEKGQVEHQVQTIRAGSSSLGGFASLEELNGWLEAECRRWAALHPHPDHSGVDRRRCMDAERPSLQPMLAPFDGFHETPHAVTGTCLISFDRNRYSVMAKAARRAVQVRAYADRIVVRLEDEVGPSIPAFRPRPDDLRSLALLPVLAEQAGRLRNARSRTGICRRHWRGSGASWGPATRPIAGSCALSAVLTDGLEAVEAACAKRSPPAPPATTYPQHPGPAPRAAPATDHRHVRSTGVAIRRPRTAPATTCCEAPCSGMR
jgi:hypothetical protein